MKLETVSVDFTDEQKRYLEGFASGLQISRVGRGLGGGAAAKGNAEPIGPHSPEEGNIALLGTGAPLDLWGGRVNVSATGL